ncbi:MAG: efflux RND transporter periplasmic adaptor subunit, partial [Candidatus Zixiibacteriota bacterium]
AAAHARYEVEQKEFDRRRYMKERDLISQAELDNQSLAAEQARAEYTGIKGMLLSAGLSDDEINEAIKHDGSSNQFILCSPADGLVVERIAGLGELANAGTAFAIIADPKSMWIEAHLTENQMKGVEPGDRLTFSSDGNGMDRIGGEIIWVSRFLDSETRMGTVRARVTDPNHRLHAGEFGRAKIVHSADLAVSLVPKNAVQWEGCCNVVFVKETQSRYRPRKVELHDGDGPYYQVTGGLRPGEEV